MRLRAESGRTVEHVTTVTAEGRRSYLLIRAADGIVMAEVTTPNQVRDVLGAEDFATLV